MEITTAIINIVGEMAEWLKAYAWKAYVRAIVPQVRILFSPPNLFTRYNISMNKQLLLKTFRNTALAAIYIFLVSQLMLHGDKVFGDVNNDVGPLVILLLFSLSAAVVGGLVFGESVLLFFDNKKRESILAAIYSVGWLGMYTALGLLMLVTIN